jgi:hypothetical protein
MTKKMARRFLNRNKVKLAKIKLEIRNPKKNMNKKMLATAKEAKEVLDDKKEKNS